VVALKRGEDKKQLAAMHGGKTLPICGKPWILQLQGKNRAAESGHMVPIGRRIAALSGQAAIASRCGRKTGNRGLSVSEIASVEKF